LKTILENAPQGKRPFRRPRLRLKDRIKEDIEKVKQEVNMKEVASDRKK